MRTKIVKTVAAGTIASLGFAAVAFPAYAVISAEQTTTARPATGPQLAVLTDPITQIPTRKSE